MSPWAKQPIASTGTVLGPAIVGSRRQLDPSVEGVAMPSESIRKSEPRSTGNPPYPTLTW